LAGTDSEVAAYKRVSEYPRIFDKHLRGATESLPDADLHRRALDLVTQTRSEALEKALADFESRHQARLVSSDGSTLIGAAFAGRVEDLFIAEGYEMQGAWNEETHEVETSEPREDLLNAAALQTILHGGRAFVLGPEDMPDAHSVAAVLRY
jgi:Bacterial archaeo-eukaryotic release factor family 3